MRIPFDNVALSAVVAEIARFVGGTVQEIRQPDEQTVTLKLYRNGQGEGVLLFSIHPQFARVHFSTRRLPNLPQPPTFCSTLRARLIGAHFAGVEQIGSDRVLTLSFVNEDGTSSLVAELMGKHSNLMLLDRRNHVVSAGKWIPRSKSSRPILPDCEYLWPPVLEEDLIEQPSPANPAEWIQFAHIHPQRVSPFFRALAPQLREEDWAPCIVPGSGAYPIALPDSFLRSTFSIALEQHYSNAEANHAIESLRANVLGQIDRTIAGRQLAIADIEETLSQGAHADRWQSLGQLILAYGGSIRVGAGRLDAWDYEGNPISIDLDPELGYVENANLYFERAKKAKGRAVHLQETLERFENERIELVGFRERLVSAQSLEVLREAEAQAKSRRWLSQTAVPKDKEDRPYDGHRIRELVGPGGVRVLFGENAESNDYLTLRVARPNDYWLHVRGAQSAHVVLVTGNAPTKIQKEQLLFAAKVAVLNSGSKHSSYVPVDYTLKKYVRKPKGSAKGSALYTNEKTLHVES